MNNTNIINLENKILENLDFSIFDLDTNRPSASALEILNIAWFTEKKEIAKFIKDLFLLIYDELQEKYNLVSFEDMFSFDIDYFEVLQIIHRYVYENLEFINNEELIKQKELELSLTHIFVTLVLYIQHKI